MISKNKVKIFRSLKQKKYRDTHSLYVAEGQKIVDEALHSHPSLIEEILCTNEYYEKNKKKLPDTVHIVDMEIVKEISSLKSPQEVLAILKISSSSKNIFGNYNDIILALDDVKDPGNLGTIIRLADWFGMQDIVCSTDCVDYHNPKVVQASMGAVLRVNVHYMELCRFIDEAVTHNYHLYGTTLEGNNIYQTKLNGRAIIVMGSESNGISENVRQKLNDEIQIPNYSGREQKTESLNVSMATSIVLSEFKRFQYYSK